MPQGKAVIGQSGGPTAVINKSLVGFIKKQLIQILQKSSEQSMA